MTEQQQFDTNYPELDLQVDRHIPLLNINIGYDTHALANETGKYFKARMIQRYYFTQEDGTLSSEVKIYEYVPCADLLLKGYKKEDLIGSNPGYFDAVFDKYLLCIDKDPKAPLTVAG